MGRRNKNNRYRQKTHKCSSKVQRLFNFHPWQSQVCSASLPGMLLAIQKHFCKLCAPSCFEPEEGRARVPHRTTSGFGSEKRAVFEIHLHENSKQTLRETWLKAEGAPRYVSLHNYYLAVCALPWATSTARSPLGLCRVLARFYPAMPCHRPDRASHVTWSHL